MWYREIVPTNNSAQLCFSWSQMIQPKREKPVSRKKPSSRPRMKRRMTGMIWSEQRRRETEHCEFQGKN